MKAKLKCGCEITVLGWSPRYKHLEPAANGLMRPYTRWHVHKRKCKHNKKEC